MHVFNAKQARYCCICKNWYDSCNAAITPVEPSINSWGVSSDMYNDRKMCQLSNLLKSAVDSCPRFECKLILK